MTEAADQALVSVLLNEDARFTFPEGDPFWARHMQRGYYEPEIDCVLRRAVDKPYALIDAGANFGYWSILASSGSYGRHAAAAIEASHGNFERLVHNANANGNRFHTLHRAVSDVPGKRVRLFGKKHYGLSLRKDWHPDDADRSEDVETTTLDEVASRYFPHRQYPAVLKIDVEGVEIEAMLGGRSLIDEGALVIYEDHGKEPSHRISRFVMSQPGIVLWSLASDDQPIRITAIEQVGAIKQNPKLGYNFFACRQPSPWVSVFEE